MAATVLRAPGRGKAKVSVVYHGPASSYRDTSIKKGVVYHYTVATTDAAGNDARVKVATTLRLRMTPAAGAVVHAGDALDLAERSRRDLLQRPALPRRHEDPDGVAGHGPVPASALLDVLRAPPDAAARHLQVVRLAGTRRTRRRPLRAAARRQHVPRAVVALPLRNRVTPLSELIADPARGLVYGNRGCLHDADGAIRRRYNGKRWIACRLAFRGWLRGRCCSRGASPSCSSSTRQRRSPPVTARARCAAARTTTRFGDAWRTVHPARAARTRSTRSCTPSASLRDAHPAPHDARLGELPDGAFVLIDDEPWVVAGDADPALDAVRLHGRASARRPAATVLITPPSLVAVLAAGWRPEAVPFLHPSSLDTAAAESATVELMADVAKILADKGGDVIRIGGEATVFDAIKAMVEANVGAILVTGAHADRIEGIFTERDYLRRIAVEGRTSRDTLVREVMTSPCSSSVPRRRSKRRWR